MVRDWHCIQMRIHRNPEKDKALTKDEWMKNTVYEKCKLKKKNHKLTNQGKMINTKRQTLGREGWSDRHSQTDSGYPDDDPLRHLGCHCMALTVGLSLESHH